MSNLRFWSITCSIMLLSVLALGWGLAQWNLKKFSNEVADRLILLNELRRGALQQYFATAEAELQFWASSPHILLTQRELTRMWTMEAPEQCARTLRSSYIENNPHPVGELRKLRRAGQSLFDDLHAELQPMASLFVTQRGYYDFFLIGLDGYVYYTVEKEDDFGTNLLEGPYSDSGLAQAYRSALESPGSVAMTDLAAYAPSAGAPAIFMAQAISDPMGQPLGVLAFQLPTDHILDIMNYTEGMGRTGETYLVGTDGLMRSDSRFSEETTVLRKPVDTVTSRLALTGEEGVQYTPDYRGVDVLSAYASMDVAGTRWAVLAEIDRDEVVAIASEERPALSGILALIYGLSLWSIWYWRGARLPADDDATVADLDFGRADGGDDGSGFMS